MFSQSLRKSKIKEACYPIMKMFYLKGISFSSDPTVEQSTITGFMSKWERRRKAWHACPWSRGVIFKQWGVSMSIRHGLGKICSLFFFNYGNFAPEFLQKPFSFLILFISLFLYFQEVQALLKIYDTVLEASGEAGPPPPAGPGPWFQHHWEPLLGTGEERCMWDIKPTGHKYWQLSITPSLGKQEVGAGDTLDKTVSCSCPPPDKRAAPLN